MMGKWAEGFRLRLLGGITSVHMIIVARLRKRRHPSAHLPIILLGKRVFIAPRGSAYGCSAE